MKKNNKKGFTLVELVIVVAVMAVLVAVAIPTIGSVVGTAEDAVAKSNARTIESVIKLAEANQTDGNTDLSAQEVADAIAEAKLGITDDTAVVVFYYNTETGAVKPAATGQGATNVGWEIKFGTVTPSGENAKPIDGVQVTPTTSTGALDTTAANIKCSPSGNFTAYTTPANNN